MCPYANSELPDTAEAHFAVFATPLINQAVSHAATLQTHPDAEVLHKLRVALRRLRSLLWAYRPLLDKEVDDRQRALFKDLAAAAGQTRDWDILIDLLGKVSAEKNIPLDHLRAARAAASDRSRATLCHAEISAKLDDALKSSDVALSHAHRHMPLKKFAQKRLQSAERTLHKRMRAASRSTGSDYEAYHEVRKAGKKVRYLLDFFEPMLGHKQLKSVKALKKIQKRFGALNDVVASQELLNDNRALFASDSAARQALKALEKERKKNFARPPACCADSGQRFTAKENGNMLTQPSPF
ncbi:CHAD domain-containing protein [Paraburkholderia sp. HD33-4]|uniref:CHAD domain-containing protein n=1 Tax=Paraburkholderia sp. HD33-4 TaxID=2883242 RepID=UPI001F4165EB|nr:CHAD domain-containing protein [Paraburkholderia sp. HD33-4]